ncbi:MAG: calcium-binding EGF-like domain-containing protein [Chitinophagaceae bacterium]|nr:calcium-binding EGF-like domain-containing protein [Chitinophagaceae bacterium]
MKKSVKLILLSALGAFSVFSTISLSSCKRDKCKTISCQNKSSCDDEDGSCICAPGYEGSMCEVTTRNKYTGTWNVDEYGTISGRNNYIVAIENSILPGATAAEVQITNLNNSTFGRVNATLKGDTIIIPEQTIDNKRVLGIGYLKNDTYYGLHGALTLRYKVTYLNTGDENDFGYVIGTPSSWHK